MHRLIISLFVAAVYLSVMAVPIFAASQQVATARAPQPERIMFHSEYGTAEMISGDFVIKAPGTRLDKTLVFFRSRPEAFRMANPAGELELLSEKTDKFGRTHLRFQQVYDGVPVWGCQTIVHFEDEQTIYLVGGQTIPTPSLPTSSAVSEAEAAAAAVAALKDQYSPDELQTASELVIYPNDGDPRLAQLVTVTGTKSGAVRWLVFVDAQTGTVLHKFDDIQFDGPDTGSGPDVLGATQTFPIYLQGTEYKMINTTRNADIYTYEDYYDGGPISTDPDGDKVWDDNEGQKAAVSGHYNADLVIAYYWNTFGRNSYDDMGHSLLVNVHDSAYVNNAYWNGEGINFADGDGINYLPLSGGLDVVAHEFTHGVTSYTAGLIYQFQSGALSEHFSDAFGAMVDRDDWLMGDDIRLAAPGFIRSLADPTLRGHPAHMDDYLTLDITEDNGGVHRNCGIPSHCFYWACELISKDVAEQIWYRCLTTYLTPSSGFYIWAGMIFQSARDLYGTTYDSEIEQALEFVGLTTVYTVPADVSISLAMGGADSYDIWVYNPGSGSVDVTAVAPAIDGLTVTEIPGNHPTIPAGGSAGFQVYADGSSMTQCDIGATRDTLRFNVVGGFTAQIRLPLTSLVSYTPAGLYGITVGTACLDFTPTNTTEVWQLSRDGVNVIWSGSLLVGLVDGNDTTVYRTTFGEEKFIPVDDIHTESGLLSFRLASEDGRILGDVEYTWDPSSADSCEFIIADYTLYNPCDTTLSILTGLMCDFDILSSASNHGYYEATDNLVYMVDDGGSRAVGYALLSRPARNLRILDNPTYVWSGNFTDEVAYLQMLETNNQDGPAANDYSALLTFGDGQLGSTDTLSYSVAWLYSNTGAAALDGILDKARAWAPGCCTGIRGNANGDPEDKANISDVSYLLAWLFGIPTGPEPACFEEGDANASGKTNITDVTYLLSWLFGIPTGPEPKPCP